MLSKVAHPDSDALIPRLLTVGRVNLHCRTTADQARSYRGVISLQTSW